MATSGAEENPWGGYLAPGGMKEGQGLCPWTPLRTVVLRTYS